MNNPVSDAEAVSLLGDDDGLQSRIAELLSELRALYIRQQNEVQHRWMRTLPFGDYIVDRWDKAKKLGFGEGSSVYDSSLVFGDVIVGMNTWIGPFTVLDGTGGLRIGDNCSISSGVQIYTHDTVKWAVSGGEVGPETDSVCIGNRCYIGPNVVICKGVNIGDGCIVGVGSFVNKDLPPGSKAWGVPARVVG